jgi:hypothetical protein
MPSLAAQAGMPLERQLPILLVHHTQYDATEAALGAGMAVVAWVGDAAAFEAHALAPLRRVVLWPPWSDRQAMRDYELLQRLVIEQRVTTEVVGPGDDAQPSDIATMLATGMPASDVARIGRQRIATILTEPAHGIDQSSPSDDAPRGAWVQPVNGRAHDVHDVTIHDDWPEPVDLFDDRPIPAFSTNWLPPSLRAYVADQCDLLGSDRGVMAMSALVTCAACLHDDVRIQPRRRDQSWTESARLWAGFVGDPGGKKSPTMARAIGHARAIDLQARKQAVEATRLYELRLRAHRAAERKWIASGAAGDAPTPPERPSHARLLLDDMTIEAAARALADNPRGMLVVRDELAGWFGSMDAYRQHGEGKDRAAWLEAYNGGPKMIERVVAGSIYVPNWSLSLIGGIQPDALRRIADKLPDDGLMQRFMLIVASEADRAGEDRIPNRSAVQTYCDVLDQLYSVQPGASPIVLSPAAADLREAADEHWRALRLNESMPPQLRAALAKWTGLWARLALTYHAIECAAAHVYPGSAEVSKDTAQCVTTMMREGLYPHALYVYESLLGGHHTVAHIRWIARYILAHAPTRLARRDIQQAYRRWRSMDWREQRDVMTRLQDSGWVRASIEQRNLPMPTAYLVNPKVAIRFEALAAAERRRRAEVAELIRETKIARAQRDSEGRAGC